MADFAKRPEVTVSTMGKVHNPTGEGVRCISSQAKAKAAKVQADDHKSTATETTATASLDATAAVLVASAGRYDTKVGKTEGSAKRNITRKKTADKDTGNYNSLHKKQGGHGKGQWKQELDPSVYHGDVEYAQQPIDQNDPLYDQAEDARHYILTSGVAGIAPGSSHGSANGVHPPSATTATAPMDGSSSAEQQQQQRRGFDPATSKAVYGPMLTRNEFKAQVVECLKEYFDSSDADEVIRSLQELGCQEYHADIVKKAISLSLDKEPRERELTSRLLTCLHPTPLSHRDIELGFIALLDSLDDLRTDVPDAETMLSMFLARAVVDEVLPPAFLSDQNNERPGDPVIEKAVTLLSREHCTARLERVWGPGDGRPVDELKEEMDQLLQEYLLSRELDEAARCVKELKAPHFHHELVKRGVSAAMVNDAKDYGAAKQEPQQPPPSEDQLLSSIDAMAALFGFLVANAIVSEYQVKKGVARLHERLPDLTLDVPTAPALLQAFEKLAVEQGCLPPSTQPSETATATTTLE